MKSIKTLLRVKQREMDALKRQQGVLERQREQVISGIERLIQQLAHEMKTAEEMPEMGHFFGSFSLTIKKRQEQLRVQQRKLEVELDKITDQIRERFSEMKTYEIAIANWEKRRKEVADRRTQQEMDEIALRSYVRRDVP